MTGSERLFVYCHQCKKRVGVATTDEQARGTARRHGCEDVSWSDEPVRESA